MVDRWCLAYELLTNYVFYVISVFKKSDVFVAKNFNESTTFIKIDLSVINEWFIKTWFIFRILNAVLRSINITDV